MRYKFQFHINNWLQAEPVFLFFFGPLRKRRACLWTNSEVPLSEKCIVYKRETTTTATKNKYKTTWASPKPDYNIQYMHTYGPRLGPKIVSCDQVNHQSDAYVNAFCIYTDMYIYMCVCAYLTIDQLA